MATEVNKELEAIRVQEAEQKKRRAEMEKAAYEGGHVSFGRAFGDGAASTGEWLVKNAPDSFKSNVANAKEQLGKGNYGAGLASAGSAALEALPTVIAGTVAVNTVRHAASGIMHGEGVVKSVITAPLKSLKVFGGPLGIALAIGSVGVHVMEQENISANAKTINELLDQRLDIMRSCADKYKERIVRGERLSDILAAEDPATFDKLNAINKEYARLAGRTGLTAVVTEGMGDTMERAAQHMDKVGGFFGTVGAAVARTVGLASDGLTWAGSAAGNLIVKAKNVMTGKDTTYDDLLSQKSNAEKLITEDIDAHLGALLSGGMGGFGPVNNDINAKLTPKQITDAQKGILEMQSNMDGEILGQVGYKGSSAGKMTPRDREVSLKLADALDKNYGKEESLFGKIYDWARAKFGVSGVSQPSLA